MENRLFALSHLDDQSLDLITSYLPIQDVLHLFACGDAILSLKMQSGAVKSLNCVHPNSALVGGSLWYHGLPMLPRLSTFDANSKVFWRCVPKKLWNRLTSITVCVGPSTARKVDLILSAAIKKPDLTPDPKLALTETMKSCFFPSLDELPSSLTSLNWTFAWSFLTLLGDESMQHLETIGGNVDEVSASLFGSRPTLAERLPNLLHLSIVHPDIEEPDLHQLRPESAVGRFKIHKGLPILFRAHPTAFIISQLPRQLVSLRLPLHYARNKTGSIEENPLFGPEGALAHLPPTLTQLSLVDDYIMCQMRASTDYMDQSRQIRLKLRHFATPLPASITDLRLVPFLFDTMNDGDVNHFGWSYLHLKRLELYHVTFGSTSSLPASLTHLTLHQHPSCPSTPVESDYKELARFHWPPSLISMTSQFSKIPSPLPLPPTLHCVTSNDQLLGSPFLVSRLFPRPIADQQFNGKFVHFAPTYFPVLQVVDFGIMWLREQQILDFGHERRLTLIIKDVALSGHSLPPSLTALDSPQVLIDEFWKFWTQPSYPYLTLRSEKQLQTIDRINFKIPPKVTSLTLPNLDYTSSRDLPASLRVWHNASLMGVQQPHHYPANLAELRMSAGAPSVNLHALLTHCPNLTTIHSATLDLDESFIPSVLHAEPDKKKSSTNGPIHRYLTLPDDAFANISVVYPNLTLTNCHLIGQTMFRTCDSFPSGWTHVTFKYHFLVGDVFVRQGFVNCVEMISLNLEEASFTEFGDHRSWGHHAVGHVSILPTLPPNLQELNLGRSYGPHLLQGWTAPWIPKTITSLRVTSSEGYSAIPWRFPDLPNLNLLIIETRFISPEHLASLPEGFVISSPPSATDGIWAVVAKRQSASNKCSVM